MVRLSHFLGIIAGVLLRTRFRHGLRHVPGPFLASFSSIWKVRAVYLGEMPRRNVAVHEKYGSVVRIGPKHVSVSSPEAFSLIYTSRRSFAKSDFYGVGAPMYRGGPLENLFSTRDVDYHANLRRNIGPLYTKTAVREFEPHVDSCVSLFTKRLSELSSNGASLLDMSLWLHLYAYDCLGEVNISRKLGFLEAGQDVGGMIAAADKIFHMVGLLLKIVFDEVDKRLKRQEPQTDMLQKFLALHATRKDKVTIRELTAAIFINLMAGHDVLAITLRAIWYYLSQDPSILATLRDEISMAREGLPCDAPLPYSTISTMPYLEAFIYESLRIHPNTGTIIERVVPQNGVTIDGFYLPGGTIVGVNAWVLHRNPEIYGKDVDVFRPERWLEATSEKRIEMEKHIFTFGAGAHTCIGKNIALMQISKLVVEFWRQFDAVKAEPEKPWKIHGSWVTKQTDMDMMISQRG
ncbi:benzoate 4-monooxygenase cytochrome P450 [Hypomontagnella monticulosa]|nr:benzoate 4-monooxygenase cytochrome P450 [Hypomontagnella monticulosa]